MNGPAQLPRLLALLPYLRSHPGVSFADAAADFGVSEDQLRKDLNLVWLCGLPGHSPGDLIDVEFEGDTIQLRDPQGVERPLRLSTDEALALLVALRTLAETPGLTDPEPVLRTLAKLEEVAGSAADPVDRVGVALEGEQTALPPVRLALESRRALHLSYHVAGRDETTERDVDPVRLVVADGHSYLEAWCRLAQGPRMFRLDRVVEARLLDEPSRPPADLPGRDLSAGVFTPSPDQQLVVLALRPEASWVVDYYPHESLEQDGNGTQVVRLRAADTGWVRRLALGAGAAVTVLEPEWLAEQVRDEARLALSAYAR